MNIHSARARVASAPALLYFKGDPRKAGLRGTVLFYHGLLVSKETNKGELEGLARAGLLAVGIDTIGHGERRYDDYDERFTSKKGAFEKNFLEAVALTVKEIPSLIDDLVQDGYSRPGGIGVCGISMGGYITYGAVVADRRIAAAVPILGNPRWRLPFPESPDHTPEKFFPTALLSQNAGDDEHVPPRFARELHEKLVPFYKEAPERLAHIEYPGERHMVSEETWKTLWSRTVEWFVRFLA
ncbi:MAG: dienelactone hydrolase family protein [Candidatus Eremiobacteraeota bacterium]|nr:dienelactone hydrolase family protein [Candidatus Eremiobacteraeota bacterium]